MIRVRNDPFDPKRLHVEVDEEGARELHGALVKSDGISTNVDLLLSALETLVAGIRRSRTAAEVAVDHLTGTKPVDWERASVADIMAREG